MTESQGTTRLEINWSHESTMSRCLHRHYAFLVKDASNVINTSMVVVGGFGQSLMKVNEYNPKTWKFENTNTCRDVLTLRQRRYLANDEATLKDKRNESKSLAGFAAVCDEVNQRVVLFGGDSASGLDNSTKGIGSFGGKKETGKVAEIYYLMWIIDKNTGILV